MKTSPFLNKNLVDLTPYTPGIQPKTPPTLKLNTNENPYPPSPLVHQAVKEQLPLLPLYPDAAATRLGEKLAAQFNVTPAQVMFGNGSDEVLAFIFQSMCEKGTAFADLTYGFYAVYCDFYGVEPYIIPLEADFSLDAEKYYNLNKTIFIANPNAPTGLALSRQTVENILENNANTLVVIDEAYVDFGAESAVPLIEQYDNLLVVGTFSKSRAMAGARLGYAVGNEAIIGDLHRVRFSFNPYSVNRMTMAAGEASLDDQPYYEAGWQKIISTRTQTQEALRGMGFHCTDSLTNFIFAAHPDVPAETVYNALVAQGIYVRWWDRPRLKNRLRITVGTDDEMQQFLTALKQIIQRG